MASFRTLAQASPVRAGPVGCGETRGGRLLVALPVGSPDDMARREEIRSGLRRLSDPREPGADEARRRACAEATQLLFPEAGR